MADRFVHCAQALLADGWRENVLFRIDAAGFIRSIGPADSADDAEHLPGLVIPGMPNVHSHGFQRLMVGLTGRRGPGSDDFWSWRAAMYGTAARLDPDQFQAVLRQAYVDMLGAGYTSCAEFHYLHHQPDGRPYANLAEMSERVLGAASECGIALTLLPVLYTRAGFGRSDVLEQQRRFRCSREQYQELLTRAGQCAAGTAHAALGFAPHSLRAVDERMLQDMLPGLEPSWPRHIHIAEQPAEVADCLAHLGARPVEWLLEHVPVDASWCLVHATHLAPLELARAARTGAVAGLCPTTEADLGDGTFEAEDWTRDGGVFGIGSDSNLRICVAEELRTLEFGQRLRSGRRNVLADASRSCGRYLYESAALGGAAAIGQPVGQLAAGCRADWVELDGAHPLLAGRAGDQALDTWLFGGGRDMVRSVWVAGREVIRDGRHAHAARIGSAFARVMKDLANA